MVNAFWTALHSRLTGGTALAALVSTRIYHDQAPDGATLPYVIYSWMGGGYINDSPSVDANGLIYVRAYSSVGQKQAGSISEAIFALLDRAPLTITGWTNVGIFGESPHIQIDVTDRSGVTVYSCGEEYRVYLDKS